MVSRIEPHLSLEAYFRDLLRAALTEERIDLEDASFAYLLQLVGDFSRPDALHGASGRQEPGTPALVWLYQEAREAPASRRFEA